VDGLASIPVRVILRRLSRFPTSHAAVASVLHRSARFLAILIVILAVLLLRGAAPATAAPVDFNRQVKPILAENCFKCHGFDEGSREGGLRLDVREGALHPAKSGDTAIVPGRPDLSMLLTRVTDQFDAMPPVETGKRLQPQEVEVLRQWIAEGALYATHWSFVPPVAAALPESRRAGWARNAIDHFVLARLERDALGPQAEADRGVLLRRVSLDLTGLPPSTAMLDAFLRDPAPDAYERAVDRLLASHHYGERMAVDWLDAARYADSNGFFRDNTRQIWPWRDWVIQAFNRNVPFDQFTVEQLAGDLLPDPTPEQRIATGFNRNHMVTGETGIIDEEYRVEYVADRMETTSTVWMGLTVGCARCHDHKYDPISQADYYRLFAFFNSSVEQGMVSQDDPPPVMDVASPAQRSELERLGGQRKNAEVEFDAVTTPLAPRIAAWATTAAGTFTAPREKLLSHVGFESDSSAGTSKPNGHLPRAVEKGSVYHEAGLIGQAAGFDGMQHLELPAELPLVADQPWTVGIWVKATGSLSCVLSKIEPSGGRRGLELIWQKGQLQVNLVSQWVVSAIEVSTREAVKRSDWNHVVVSYDGSQKAAGVRVFIDGIPATLTVNRDTLAGSISNREPVRVGRRDSGLGFYGQLDELRILSRTVAPDEARTWFWSERLQGVLGTAPDQRDLRQKKLLLDCYVEREGDATSRETSRRLGQARNAEDRFRAMLPKTLVMQEVANPPQTHLLKRGQYDAPGEVVTPGVPGALPSMPAAFPRNRLGLAKWIASPAHPLTARVAVNRLWQQCFGVGLVRTPNDFGAQGELPTHPELLDWLAVRFVESGWDVKALLRFIVTSATYRQSSVPTRELLQQDPENRLLARGPRFRLGGEMIRDQALAVSGLLVDKLGGPPVKPYQPPGLWEAVSYNGEMTYQADQDDGRWRRSVYSYWKRTSPPPGVQVLDGPTRETCVVSRPRTNTPLQALLMLNDETFVEAARALGAVAAAPADTSREQRIIELFRRATLREPGRAEIATLGGLFTRQRERFTQDRTSALQLVRVGGSMRGHEQDPVELAAWTMVAQAILNLDEVVMRR